MLTIPRFPGATEFAFPGSGSNQIIPLLSRIPVPGTTTRDPNKETAVLVSDTMFRSLSTTEICVVQSSGRPLPAAAAGRGPAGARPAAGAAGPRERVGFRDERGSAVPA